VVELPQGSERWIVVRSAEGVERARATLQRQASRDLTNWTKRLWHLGNAPFACQADAEAALVKAVQRLPEWVQVQVAVKAVSKQAKPGRPRKDAVPVAHVWRMESTVTLDPVALEAEALRRAAYIIGTNLLDEEAWPDEAVIALYHEQTVVEKGFAFLKDPLAPLLVGLCEKAGAHHGPGLHHGAVFAGLQVGRGPSTAAPGGNRADGAGSGGQINKAPDDALGVPMLRGD
jgi:transposase